MADIDVDMNPIIQRKFQFKRGHRELKCHTGIS
jgi:hypothetical protein